MTIRIYRPPVAEKPVKERRDRHPSESAGKPARTSHGPVPGLDVTDATGDRRKYGPSSCPLTGTVTRGPLPALSAVADKATEGRFTRRNEAVMTAQERAWESAAKKKQEDAALLAVAEEERLAALNESRKGERRHWKAGEGRFAPLSIPGGAAPMEGERTSAPLTVQTSQGPDLTTKAGRRLARRREAGRSLATGAARSALASVNRRK